MKRESLESHEEETLYPLISPSQLGPRDNVCSSPPLPCDPLVLPAFSLHDWPKFNASIIAAPYAHLANPVLRDEDSVANGERTIRRALDFVGQCRSVSARRLHVLLEPTGDVTNFVRRCAGYLNRYRRDVVEAVGRGRHTDVIMKFARYGKNVTPHQTLSYVTVWIQFDRRQGCASAICHMANRDPWTTCCPRYRQHSAAWKAGPIWKGKGRPRDRTG
jgi:hypothetical protein